MNKLSYFKIGLFVISATVLAVIGIIALGVGSVFQRAALVETYIEESVQGLDIGSPMKFRGVLVGKVEEITLTSAVYDTKRRYVLVRVGITSNLFQFPLADPNDPSFKSELDRGFRVPLEIDWEPKYPYIPSARSRIIQLSDSVESILQNFEQLDIPRLVNSVDKSLTAITRMAEGANVEKIGAQANVLLAEVRETNRQLKDLVASPELKSTLVDAAAVAGSARQIIERAEKPLNQMLADLPQVSESLERLVKRLDSVSADLPDTSAQLRQTVQRLNRLISSQQQDIEKTVDNLRSISENLKELTEDSKKYPSQLLFGGPPPPSKVMQR
jgi:phospholipid/cholesterol/gamma-HCH transport system substrate-binding protein